MTNGYSKFAQWFVRKIMQGEVDAVIPSKNTRFVIARFKVTDLLMLSNHNWEIRNITKALDVKLTKLSIANAF